jgi:hypothetical protein
MNCGARHSFCFFDNKKGEKMSPEKKKKRLKDILEEAREAVTHIEDPKLRPKVLVAIAIVSNNPVDLKAINVAIGQMERGSLRSEAVAVVAKRLAQAGKITQARELVFGISPVDAYWRAETCARIGLYSRDSQDFGQARRFATDIKDSFRRKETLAEIDTYENNPEFVREEDKRVEQKELVALVNALANIGEIDKAHEVAGAITIAYFRARALASVARILAEAM